MARRPKPSNEESLTVQKGTAGPANRLDREAMRARAEASDLLPPQALDERQAAIGTKRRSGGPPLAEEVPEAEAQVPNVPPTETMKPPV
jgi:hypothetical protein